METLVPIIPMPPPLSPWMAGIGVGVLGYLMAAYVQKYEEKKMLTDMERSLLDVVKELYSKLADAQRRREREQRAHNEETEALRREVNSRPTQEQLNAAKRSELHLQDEVNVLKRELDRLRATHPAYKNAKKKKGVE